MRLLRLTVLSLLLAAFGAQSQATVVYIEGFEDPQTLGVTPAGWTVFGTNASVVTDDEQVLEGNQSALIPSGGASSITKQGVFGQSGEYHWMFYDDMADAKNVRVGLDRTTTFPNNAPRFAAIAVEASIDPDNYVWHHSFSFGSTTVPRSEGWRHMHLAWDVVEGNTVVEYYIDGQLGHTQPYVGAFTPTAEWVGSPFGTATPAWVDAIPEPSSFLLSALGLVGVAGFRRRTKL